MRVERRSPTPGGRIETVDPLSPGTRASPARPAYGTGEPGVIA
jgi:hypothetical protein